MDSQLAAVLTNRGTASLNRSHLPERTGKSMEMPPLTDIQDVPIDLSLKSSCSLPLDSQPLCYKMAPSCNYKAKQFYWRETRIQGRMEETSKDSTDTIEIVAEVTGVHKPVLSNIDSLPNSCKNSLTPGFTGCLLEQKGVTSESLSSDQSESHTASLVTVKDEIEEVCIGELEGYSDDQSDSQGSLNEGLTRDIADGTDMQNAIVSGANSNMVPMDTITALNTEPEDIAADSCGFTAREASPSEGQSPGLNGDVSSLLGVEMQVNKQPKFNLGILSDGGEIPIKGGDAEGEEKEMARWKGRKKCSSRHAPAYSIRTRSQRRREMNREAKAECGKEDNTLFGKETQKREVLLQSSPPASDLPGRFQGLCETEGEQDAGADADRIGKGRECQQKLQEEVLDLSLSRKGGRSNTVCRKGGFEEGIETSLLMEVDEIVQQEVAEDEEDAEIGSRERQAAIGFDLPNGEAPFSSSSAPPSPSASPSVDPSLADLLLIDNQGVPYTLTPDGQKVFQVELPKPHKAFSVRPRPKSKQVKPKDSTVSAALSNQVLPNALPCQPSGATPSCLIPPASPGSSDDSKTASSSGAKSSSLAAPQPPTLLDLEPQSQPIRILANSATTSPILLLPSSQLSSLSPSKPNTNSGLMALSLPVSLTQNSTSTPLLLVISPLPTGSAPSTSSPILAVPSSVSLSQTTSPPAVSLPLYSVQTNLESSFPTNPAVPVLNPESFTLFPATSGNSNQCTPSSPSVSSSTGGPIPDLSSKEIIPKLSPNRLMKSDPASDTKSSSITETQIECAQSPILASLSPKEIPPYQIRHSLKTSPPSASANPFSADDQSYPISGTPPPETIFPTNHPKNLNLSPNCPRRILYCQFCPRAFYYLSDLERHSITHSQSKPHVCSLCSKAFKRSSHLERHKHIHTGQRNFICPICSKRFREAGELLRHQRVHTGEKPFQCLQCHMRFAERNTLRRHAKRKHQEQQGPDGQEEGGRYSDDIQEDSAEWYSSTVPELDSDNETD